MTAHIGREEWLAELLKAERTGAEGFSVRDLQAQLGCSNRVALETLRKWMNDGRVRHAGSRPSTALNGKPCWTPVYQVVK